MSLGIKIRKFRQERGYTLTTLAEKLEVSPSFLSLVERDKKKPSLIMLKKISSILHISLSYLTGISSDNTMVGQKLNNIRNLRSLSIDDLAELSELSREEIESIESETTKPSMEQIEKIAKALNIQTEYFVSKHLYGLELGDKIRNRRQELDMSQAQLAARAKISPALVSQLESKITLPSLETLETLAEALETEVSFFLVDNTLSSDRTLANLSPEMIAVLGDLKVQNILAAISDLNPGELDFVLNFINFFKLNKKSLD